jgi:ATP-dependent RNA helicase DDX35
MVVCTEPLRFAAASIASRVCLQRNVTMGSDVGYLVAYDQCWDSRSTKILYAAEESLLHMTLKDPLLSHFSVVMLDEVHRRSVPVDVLCALLLQIKKKRQDLRILLSSSVLEETATLSSYFHSHTLSVGTILLTAEQVATPVNVDVYYLKEPCMDYMRTIVNLIQFLHQSEVTGGTILVFLPCNQTIQQLEQLLQDAPLSNVTILPLYLSSRMDKQLQSILDQPSSIVDSDGFGVGNDGNERNHPQRRSIIVTTTLAETMIPFPNVSAVIDSMLVKVHDYDRGRQCAVWKMCPISQLSAHLRAQRCESRVSGSCRCFRLCTHEIFEQLPTHPVPEIYRTELSPLLLLLMALGVRNAVSFAWPDPLPRWSVQDALQRLLALQAIEGSQGRISDLGRAMMDLPHQSLPMARSLLSAQAADCLEAMCGLAAMLTVKDVFAGNDRGENDNRYPFAVNEGDHLTLLNVYTAFHTSRRRREFCREFRLSYPALARAVDIAGQIKQQVHQAWSRYPSLHTTLQQQRWEGESTTSLDRKEDLTFSLRKCLIFGYFMQAAQVQSDGTYRSLSNDEILQVHPSSVLCKARPSVILFHETYRQEEVVYVKEVCAVELRWLLDAAPHFYAPRQGQNKRARY